MLVPHQTLHRRERPRYLLGFVYVGILEKRRAERGVAREERIEGCYRVWHKKEEWPPAKERPLLCAGNFLPNQPVTA
jgi:hypothetical protein